MTKNISPKPITKKHVAAAIKEAIPTASFNLTVNKVGLSRHSSIHPTVCVSIHPRKEGMDGQAILEAAQKFVKTAAKDTTWDGKPFNCDITVHIRNEATGARLYTSHMTFEREA